MKGGSGLEHQFPTLYSQVGVGVVTIVVVHIVALVFGVVGEAVVDGCVDDIDVEGKIGVVEDVGAVEDTEDEKYVVVED